MDRIYEFGIAAHSIVRGVVYTPLGGAGKFWKDAAGADHHRFAWGHIPVDIYTDVDQYE